MLPSTRLKFASLFFGTFWALGMFWWSGAYDVVNAVTLMIGGIAAGFGWYWLMRRLLPRRLIPSRP